MRPLDTPSSRGRWYTDLDGRRMSWTSPRSPILHTKGQCGAEGVPVLDVPENVTTVELVINNLSPTEHILHMHGGYFRVINVAKFDWCTIDKARSVPSFVVCVPVGVLSPQSLVQSGSGSQTPPS